MLALKCIIILGVSVAASTFELGSNDVVFHLFTRNNPSMSQPLLPSIQHIMASQFSPARRTIITIHNNGEDVTGNFNAFLIPQHIIAEDVNLIAVDWSRGSGMYTQGLGNADQCGQLIANFINFLSGTLGYQPSNYRIVGVGLGAHIAGIAARKVNGKIPHIVAIDPAFHGWTHNPAILNPNDAGVVEVLHATAGSTGYDYPLGDIDFYPNGGSVQTGCNTPSCSRTYAYAFYAESIEQSYKGGARFVGTRCGSYEQAISLSCNGERDAVFGGIQVKTSENGIYTFLTNIVPPFARN